jgi:hypothetical protein
MAASVTLRQRATPIGPPTDLPPIGPVFKDNNPQLGPAPKPCPGRKPRHSPDIPKPYGMTFVWYPGGIAHRPMPASDAGSLCITVSDPRPCRTTARRGLPHHHGNRSARAGCSLDQPLVCPRIGAQLCPASAQLSKTQRIVTSRHWQPLRPAGSLMCSHKGLQFFPIFE